MSEGLYSQINKSNVANYSDSLTLEKLDKFIYDLGELPKNREIVTPIGEFQSRYLTALVNNNEEELRILDIETTNKHIERLVRIAIKNIVDVTILIKLSDKYNERYHPLNKGISWEINNKILEETDYSCEYEITEIELKDKKWFEKVYYSNDFETKLLSTKEIDIEYIKTLINE